MCKKQMLVEFRDGEMINRLERWAKSVVKFGLRISKLSEYLL